MKINLTDAAFYGEWCSERKAKYKIKSWLERSSLQFFSTEKLINEFGYKDCDEIESSGHFIPVFKRDTVALKKEFVASLHLKDIEDEIQSIMEHNDKHSNSPGYDAAFSILCEQYNGLEDDYCNYERNQLLKDAKKWCQENNIPYYTRDDAENKLNLSEISLYGYDGGVRLDVNGKQIPISYWLCRKDLSVFSLDDGMVPEGYKNNEDNTSGMFVPLIKANIKKFEKEYMSNFHDEKAEEKINLLMDENRDYSYEDAFWYLIVNTSELCIDWMRYKEKQFLKEAEQWAIENNIPYYIPKNSPEHLGSKIKNNG